TFFENFILDWDETLRQKSQQYEWGDHVDINAMSELYNVRVQVYELNKATNKLYMSYDQGVHENTQDLPVLLLARHRKKHYNIIKNPEAYLKNPRPLGGTSNREGKTSIREIRLKEEEAAPENKEEEDLKEEDDEEEEEDEGEGNNGNENSQSSQNNHNNQNNQIHQKRQSSGDVDDKKINSIIKEESNPTYKSLSNPRENLSDLRNRGMSKRQLGGVQPSLFPVQLQIVEFNTILDKNIKKRSGLNSIDVTKVFGPCLERLCKNVRQKWEQDHPGLSTDVLDRFYQGRYSGDNLKTETQRFVHQLQEKTHREIFDGDVILSTFNNNVANTFTENLSSVVLCVKDNPCLQFVERIIVWRCVNFEFNDSSNNKKKQNYSKQFKCCIWFLQILVLYDQLRK
ncbi:hypothetical protein RFI_14817, partial [Reticulomyxa filosa]